MLEMCRGFIALYRLSSEMFTIVAAAHVVGKLYYICSEVFIVTGVSLLIKVNEMCNCSEGGAEYRNTAPRSAHPGCNTECNLRLRLCP